MVFCIVREKMTPKIPVIENAIEDYSMQVFKSGFHQHRGVNYPIALCINCPIINKRKRGKMASESDCRFHEYLTFF